MKNIEQYIDHTILNANATESDIMRICEEAKKYNFKTVCIQPYWVNKVNDFLKNSNVGITTVIGFPLGANTTEIKAIETVKAISDGATEIDMVINIGALKDKEYDIVLNDIKAVVAAAGSTPVKVIIETALLTKEEKIKASELSKKAGAAFVKTSTGFSTAGANVEDIRLMRATVGPEMGVKASGGVRTFEDAKKMIDAGATRIGASSSVDIVNSSNN